MQLLIVADRDDETRKQIIGFFSGSEYRVIESDSVDVVLRNVLKKEARVILLGSEFDGLSAVEIIPLLKKCNHNLTIILISDEESLPITDEESLPLIRKFCKEEIFHHTLKPVNGDDRKGIRQLVQCAFHNSMDRRLSPKGPALGTLMGKYTGAVQKIKGELLMKTAISAIYLVLAVISPALAADTVVYKSGILVSIFVGVCALVVVAQLVPALMLVVGFIKGAVASMHQKETPATESTPNGN